MNNNNLYTNNNFIGTTHLDTGKITSNFILATSNILEQHIYTNSINNSNFTTETSNILEQRSSNFILTTSNILETHSSNFTNALRADVRLAAAGRLRSAVALELAAGKVWALPIAVQ